MPSRRRTALVLTALGLLLPGTVVALAQAPASARTVLPPGAVHGAGTIGPYARQRIGEAIVPDPASTFVDRFGDVGVARYHPASGSMEIASYDASTYQPTGRTASLTVTAGSFRIFGSFYAAPDGSFFTLAGRADYSRSDDADVVEVKHYDSHFALLGTGHLGAVAAQGGAARTTVPFDGGAADQALVGDRLVVHMPRRTGDGSSSDPVRHTDLTFEVDVPTMTATPFSELGDAIATDGSERQLVTTNGSTLVTVDENLGGPRSVLVGLMPGYPAARRLTTKPAYTLPGSGTRPGSADITVDDLVSGPQGVTVLGVDGGHACTSTNGFCTTPLDGSSNLLAVHVDPATGESRSSRLTDFREDTSPCNSYIGTPRAVQVATDRFAVIADVGNHCVSRSTLRYFLIDSAGTVLAQRSISGVLGAAVSEPVLSGHRIVWTSNQGDDSGRSRPAYLMALDVTDPAAPTTVKPTYVGDQATVDRTDVTGDGKADLGVFRPSTGQWLVQGRDAVAFGRSGDLPVPADYTGDGRADLAVFRPSSATWYLQGQPSVAFGRGSDAPVPADYDGDGKADLAVYRPSTGAYYVRGSATVILAAGGVPVPADYDGDGKAEPAVFRDGRWSLPDATTTGFGTKGDVPVPADYDGDGTAELAVYRPSTRQWFVRGQEPVAFGSAGDVPLPLDVDADGAAELAVYRPSTGQWFVQGAAGVTVGQKGDVPLR